MVKFIGVKEAKPLALCQQGANPHAHVLMTKTRKSQPTPVPEITDMNIAALKAIALMNDVTKTHFAGLADDAATAFLAKTLAEQTAEAEAAAKAAKDAETEKAAKLAGKSANEMALEKRLADQDETIAALKAKDEEREIEKRAAAEFAGYPGGVPAAAEMLKSFKELPEATVKNLEQGMKDRIEANKTLTRTIGLSDAEKTAIMPATAKIDAAAKALAVEKKINYHAAYLELSEDKAWAEAFDTARHEGVAA